MNNLDIKCIATGSNGNCYLVSDPSTKIILEAGITYKKILRAIDFEIGGIGGCVVSHSHLDHCKAALDLAKNGIEIYTTIPVIEAKGLTHPNVNKIYNQQPFDIGTFKILPFDVQHDVPNSGFIIYSSITKEKLLFITDAYYCKYKFKNLAYIMIEINYDKNTLLENVGKGYVARAMKQRLLTSHFSLENAKKYLNRIDLKNVKEIMIIHSSGTNLNPKKVISEIKGVTGKPTRLL